MRPLLSICIPTFNRSAWLRASLSTLLPQTEMYPNEIEVIISDNCSEDETMQVVKSAQSTWEGIRYNRNETNIGAEPNFYRLVGELAQGDYVWLLGDDDFVNEGAIETVMSTLKQHLELDYFYVNYVVWNTDTAPLSTVTLPNENLAPGHKDFSSRYLPQLVEIVSGDPNCFTPVSCSIMRRDMAKAAIFRDPYPAPFSTRDASVPLPVYIALNLLDKPAWYFGQPLTVLATANTWSKYHPVFDLWIKPSLYDIFEEAGTPRKAVDVLRRHQLENCSYYMYKMLFDTSTIYREKFSLVRYIYQNRSVPSAQLLILSALKAATSFAIRDKLYKNRIFRHVIHRRYLRDQDCFNG